MQPRLAYAAAAPEAVAAVRHVEAYLRSSGLESGVMELVKIRASQINTWNRLAVSFRAVPGEYVSRVSSPVN